MCQDLPTVHADAPAPCFEWFAHVPASSRPALPRRAQIEYTLAKLGAEKFWKLLQTEPYIPALGALAGNQAVQMAKAGLKAIYLSGWQVAADNNTALQTYPDQSLYPVNSVPQLVKRINNVSPTQSHPGGIPPAELVSKQHGVRGGALVPAPWPPGPHRLCCAPRVRSSRTPL